MAALNQDFITYVGDDVSPIFTVTNNGVVVDISAVSEITWTARRTDSDVAVLTKTKTGGGITFVNTGTDGKFQVAITDTDTAVLSGFYIHQASIISGTATTTVTVGRMQVGIKPTWTYDPTLIATSSLYQVRRLIGDTIYGEQQMQDEEINWYISQYSNIYLAAANCCRAIAAQFSRMVDTIQGELRILYSNRQKNYSALAAQLERIGMGRSTTMIYAGGISQIDKSNQVQDTDRVPPQFNLMMDDNLIPLGEIGNQTPSPGAPTQTPFPGV